MSKNKGIIAYGTEEDREKLEKIAALEARSGSSWIINMIRQRYKELFND